MRRKQQQQQEKKKLKRDRGTIGSAEQTPLRKNKSSLSRSIRSNNKVNLGSRQQQQQMLRSGGGGGDISSQLSMLSRLNYPGLMMNGDVGSTMNETQEKQQQPMVVNLNPDLCYQVGGLTPAQKKLCVQNTSIMPAISRGARAAIQVSDFANL